MSGPADGARSVPQKAQPSAQRRAGDEGWLDLATLIEPVTPGAAGSEVVALPALRWLLRLLAPHRVARLGIGSGCALEALARHGDRIGPSARIVAAGGGEASEPVLARLRARHAGEVVFLDDASDLGGLGAGEGFQLVSLSAPSGAFLEAVRPALAPGGVVVVDAPDGAAAERAATALAETFGGGAPSGILGGVVLSVPGGSAPEAVTSLLRDAGRQAALGALLERLGRGLAAQAREEGGAPAASLEAQRQALAALDEAEALRAALSAARRARDEDAAAMARDVGARERALGQAEARVAALEAEVAELRDQLARRFEEIAALTRERVVPASG